MTSLSRRKISDYVAKQLLAGDLEVITQLAAFLDDTNRTKELDLIVRDIEDALKKRGLVVADVTSARDLDAAVRTQLEQFIKDKTSATRIQFRETVDASLIGGVRISLPGAEMDTSVKRKLMQLKASKA